MWDVVVLDNATIHGKGDNRYLVEWAWENFRILIIFLPTGSPEFNPQENVWGLTVKRMQIIPKEIVNSIKRKSLQLNKKRD